jgi:hypothetical protein
MTTRLAFLSIVAIVALSLFFAWIALSEIGNVSLGFAGWLALCFGAVCALALAGGLAYLMQYSRRKGYDDPHPSSDN